MWIRNQQMHQTTVETNELNNNNRKKTSNSNDERSNNKKSIRGMQLWRCTFLMKIIIFRNAFYFSRNFNRISVSPFDCVCVRVSSQFFCLSHLAFCYYFGVLSLIFPEKVMAFVPVHCSFQWEWQRAHEIELAVMSRSWLHVRIYGGYRRPYDWHAGSVFNDLVGQKGPKIRFWRQYCEIITAGAKQCRHSHKNFISNRWRSTHSLCNNALVSPLTIRIMPR